MSAAESQLPVDMKMLPLDLIMAQHFLDLLGTGEEFTFQTIAERQDVKNSRALAHAYHGKFADYAAVLEDLNHQGAGVFVMVNEGDGIVHQGSKTCRTNANVVRVRAIFVDLDGAPLEPVTRHRIPPRIIVETSRGRWHCYWPTDDCPLDRFKDAQKALAKQFNGDGTVNDLARVMRLPGFVHQKSEPFVSQLVFPEATQ